MTIGQSLALAVTWIYLPPAGLEGSTQSSGDDALSPLICGCAAQPYRPTSAETIG
jgi:hypothetical protein